MDKTDDFFIFGNKEIPATYDHYHRWGCSICPLGLDAKRLRLKHPQMPAYGAKQPDIYALGEAPGGIEDARGIPFVGPAGRLLHSHIPAEWKHRIRFNNCVRTRPEENKTPTQIPIECCRPSVASDIEFSAPKAIFGFGNIPLHWMISQNGINNWRGRRIPVKIGGHACWFFPMLHPSYILHLESQGSFQHEQMAFTFEMDLKHAFTAVKKDLPKPIIHTKEMAKSDIECVYDSEHVIELLELAVEQPMAGLDLETVGTRPYGTDSRILTCAISTNDGTFAFPLRHRECTWAETELWAVEAALTRFLESDCHKICFTPFEMEWLAYFYGRDCLHSPWEDSQAQAYIINPTGLQKNQRQQGPLSLNFLCIQHFSLDVKSITNTDKERLAQTPLDVVLLYNGIDAKYHRLLYLAQTLILNTEGLDQVYKHRIQHGKAAVLTQLKGVPINAEAAKTFDGEYKQHLTRIEADIESLERSQRFRRLHRHAYRPSALQDIKAAFKLDGSVDEEALKKVDDPLAKLTLEWRHNNKILSTYIKPILADSETSVLWPDGMLHPQLRLITTRTGRTSADDCNYQNWPKHDDVSKKVRSMVSSPGLMCVAFDYGQIQARNVAMESMDEELVRSFWERHDIHADWAEIITRMYPKWAKEGAKKLATDKELFGKYRQLAKNLFVFPSFFGASGKSIAKYLGIPEEIGWKLSDKFWDQFQGVRVWQQGIRQFYTKYGYVTGLSGFRRYAPIASTETINTPIQSDEAYIVLDTMARLAMKDDQYIANLMVHDDLTFLWPNKEVDRHAEIVIDHMLKCPFEWAHRVPIAVEMSIGPNWADMKKAGTFESDTWNGELRKKS